MKKIFQMRLITLIIFIIPSFNSLGYEINDQFQRGVNKRVEKIKLIDKSVIVNGQNKYNEYLSSNIKLDGNDMKIIEGYVNFRTESFYVKSMANVSNAVLNGNDKSESIFDFVDKTTDLIAKHHDTLILNDKKLLNGSISVSDHQQNIKKIMEEYLINFKALDEENDKNIEDEKNHRTPRFTKFAKKRELARNDVVAQVLNYASGVREDASGATFYYPESTENGQCIYKVAMNKSNPMASTLQGLLNASNFISSVTGIQDLDELNSAMRDNIDLSKADLKNVTFYKLQGAQRNKFTGDTAYLRYQSRVEGLPDIFECDSTTCNIDRLKRGWKLVESKCKGIKKAF